MSIKAILLLVGLVAIASAITYWLIYLVKYDGVDVCDKSQCDSCPFPPCESEVRNEQIHY